MNALPTHDRLAYAGDDFQPYCPVVTLLLLIISLSKLKALFASRNLSAEITKWTKRNGIITPSFSFRFGQTEYDIYNPIFRSTLFGKTVCAMNHSDKPNLFEQRYHAKNLFKRELPACVSYFQKSTISSRHLQKTLSCGSFQLCGILQHP